MNGTQRCFALNWRVLTRWDLKGARAASFRIRHPDFKPMGAFVEEATELVRPADQPEKEWPVYGVNNRNGVFFSHHQKGSEFNSNYKRIRADWFFHNPTRANVGSLGRVPSVPDDAITSPEYQVWRIKEGLLPEFVEVLLRTRFFLDLVEVHRVGSVKQRLFVQNLMEIPIPVFSKEKQAAVVKLWRKPQEHIAGKKQAIASARAGLEKCFLQALGLPEAPARPLPKVMGLRWSEMGRWGVGYNQHVMTAVDLTAGKYPLASLGRLLDKVQYGTSQRANLDGEGTPVIRMNNLMEGRLDLSDLKHVKLSDSEIAGLALQEGDILINRTNSKELVGKCAVFHEPGLYVFASYLIRLRVKEAEADPDYLAWAINSVVGRQQIDALSRQIIGQANINAEEIRSLQVPVPPPKVQRSIMTEIGAGLRNLDKMEDKLEAELNTARQQIESQILTGEL
jgi:type I restriction enzyme S subunit